MAHTQMLPTACHSEGLADILERVLDKGVVIAGDIRIKLCDIELLSIQIRLLIAFRGQGPRNGPDLVVAAAANSRHSRAPHYLPGQPAASALGPPRPRRKARGNSTCSSGSFKSENNNARHPPPTNQQKG